MKWLLFFNFLVLLGLCFADISGSIGEVMKSAERETFSEMAYQFLPRLEAAIISNCGTNGHENEVNQLQRAYNDMKICIQKKPVYITPKDEFITNIEECSKESIERTNTCMTDDQKYFPVFMLDLVKSVVNFMYNKHFDAMRVDLGACLSRFNNYSVQKRYIQCLTDTATETHDSSEIPTSKASLCDKIIPASRCFTDLMKTACDRTANLDQYREDYMEAVEVPCEKKELI